MENDRREADLVGRAGRAWLSKDPGIAEHATTIAAWILCAPGAHPAWSFYQVTLVHLRPVEGLPPPVLKRPGVEHEIAIMALHPDTRPLPDDTATWVFLTPPNAAGQFGGLDDADAERVLKALVAAFVSGKVSPDSDYRRAIEGSIRATAECYVAGNHRPS